MHKRCGQYARTYKTLKGKRLDEILQLIVRWTNATCREDRIQGNT